MDMLIGVFGWGLFFGAGFTLGRELMELATDAVWQWWTR